MMKYLRYIFISILACLAFMFIDDVSAATINVLEGSCTTHELRMYYDYYYGDIECTPNSVFLLMLDGNGYQLSANNTFIGSFTLFTGSITDLNVIPSLNGYAYSPMCSSTPDFSWCKWYTPTDYFTVYKYFDNSGAVWQPFKIGVSGRIAFGFTMQTVPGDYSNTLNSRYNSYMTSVNSGKLDSINGSINDVDQSIKDTNDTIKDTDTSGASDTAGGFFDNFEDNDFGLSDIITMPLQTIKNMSSATCLPLTFPIPFVDTDMTLPCMSEVYSKFGSILTIYQTITFGMIAYWVVVNIYASVRNFKNPDSDEIEVVSL